MVVGFDEKPVGDGKRINGGFFLMEPAVFDYISGDATVLETDVLPVLAQMSELSAFRHDGFWQPMDTLRDKKFLEEILASGSAPWVRDSK
jgi:glucose-1-phosphate cytidylyltransferase